MTRLLIALAALALLNADIAQAHIGEEIYLIYEIPDGDLPDVTDGDLSDWDGLIPNPLTEADFVLGDNVFIAPEIDPTDLAYTVYLGWNESRQHLYLAVDRVDDVYVNEYGGGDPGNMWRHDSVEFMIDGDHSGGEYLDRSHAQQYFGIADTPDGQYIGQGLTDSDWDINPPYADGGGSVLGGTPHRSVVEMYVTAFDVRDDSGPAASTPSLLTADKIIGLQISMPDFDTYPTNYQSFATLSGKAATWRFAERFVDARLVSSIKTPPGHAVRVVRDGDYSGVRALTPDAADKGLDTAEDARANKGKGRGKVAAIQTDSWARIKAAFRAEE